MEQNGVNGCHGWDRTSRDFKQQIKLIGVVIMRHTGADLQESFLPFRDSDKIRLRKHVGQRLQKPLVWTWRSTWTILQEKPYGYRIWWNLSEPKVWRLDHYKSGITNASVYNDSLLWLFLLFFSHIYIQEQHWYTLVAFGRPPILSFETNLQYISCVHWLKIWRPVETIGKQVILLFSRIISKKYHSEFKM